MKFNYSLKKQLLDMTIPCILLPFVVVIVMGIIFRGKIFNMDLFYLGGIISVIFTVFLSFNLKGTVYIEKDFVERVSMGVKIRIDWKDVVGINFKSFKSQLELVSVNKKMIFHDNYVNHKQLCNSILDEVNKVNSDIKVPPKLNDYLHRKY